MKIPTKYRNILAVLLLAAVVAGAFFAHLNLFSRTEYVNGTDGGFYAYKTREILEEGIYNFSLSSPPVIFLTSAVFAKVFGVFDGIKIATTLYSVLLGVSVFILTRYLTKSNRAGLIAAFFATFSPMSLRIAADIRKNAAALFFMPLIIYFYLKFTEATSPAKEPAKENPSGWELLNPKGWTDWKYVIPLAITGILGILSHSSVITIWFTILGYLALYLGLKWFDLTHHERKLVIREFIPVFAANLAVVILMVYFYNRISTSLDTIAAPPGPITRPMFEELNVYLLPLMATAVPGVLLAFRRKSRGDILLLAWLILLFLLTLSQTVGPSEYWRFALLMFVPVTIFVGYSFDWLLKNLRYVAPIILLVTAVITTRQFLDFGTSNPQMTPQLNEEILRSLQAAADRIGENNYVYTSCPHHPYYWVRYFFGSNTKRYFEDSVYDVNDLIGQGQNVYFARGKFEMDIPPEEVHGEKTPGIEDPGRIKGKMDFKPNGFELDPTLREKYLETVYEDDNVTLLKLKSAIEPSDAEKLIALTMMMGDIRPDVREYEFERFKYLSTYLILPYEIINMLNPSYLPLWQIQLGLPLSLLIVGLAASLLLRITRTPKIAKGEPPRWLQISAIAIGVSIVFLIYGFSPSIFWGTPQMMGPNGDGAPPSMNGQEGEEIKEGENGTGWPCGDGICDEVEQADPAFCPKDCE